MFSNELIPANEAEILPIMLQVFMAAAAMMCLLAATMCVMVGRRKKDIAPENTETFPMWERPRAVLLPAWPPPPVTTRRLRRRSFCLN
jgi:hypothetical protein